MQMEYETGSPEKVATGTSGFWTTLEAYGAVGDFDPQTLAGTDDSDAIAAAIQALYDHGGGDLYLGRAWYRATRCFAFPNNSTGPRVFGQQPAIRIFGQGSGGNGHGVPFLAASGIFWTAEAGAEEAKLVTTGLGSLTLLDFQMASGPDLAKPFVKTTFTTIYAYRMAWCTGRSGRSCTQDALILGGTVDHEADPNYDLRLSNAGFQGYGTVIDGCFFSGIRCCAILQRFANSIRIDRNTVWSNCGMASGPASAAFYVNGQAVDNGAGASTFTDNLIESSNYDYGIIAENCFKTRLIGNDIWDVEATTLGGVWLKPTASSSFVLEGFSGGLYGGGSVGKYLLDEGAGAPNTYIAMENEQRSKLVALETASSTDNPNLFGPTIFNDPGNTIFQPAVPGLSYFFRSLTVSGEPGYGLYSNGQVEWGPAAAAAGDVVNYAPSSMSWSQNGRFGTASAGAIRLATPDSDFETWASRSFFYSTDGAALFGGFSAAGVNLDSARTAATTPGAVKGKVAVVDASGSVVGYLALYDEIA